MDTLEDVRKFLSTIPDINAGGCAIAALVFHRWLKQNNQKSSIMFYYGFWDGESFNQNKKYIKGETDNGATCSHAKIKYKLKSYDTHGFERDGRRHHIIPEHLAVSIINKRIGWNPCFNRKHVKTIQKRTGIDLSDIVVW